MSVNCLPLDQDKHFIRCCLKGHNFIRETLHGVPPLEWDDACAKSAMETAISNKSSTHFGCIGNDLSQVRDNVLQPLPLPLPPAKCAKNKSPKRRHRDRLHSGGGGGGGSTEGSPQPQSLGAREEMHAGGRGGWGAGSKRGSAVSSGGWGGGGARGNFKPGHPTRPGAKVRVRLGSTLGGGAREREQKGMASPAGGGKGKKIQDDFKNMVADLWSESAWGNGGGLARTHSLNSSAASSRVRANQKGAGERGNGQLHRDASSLSLSSNHTNLFSREQSPQLNSTNTMQRQTAPRRPEDEDTAPEPPSFWASSPKNSPSSSSRPLHGGSPSGSPKPRTAPYGRFSPPSSPRMVARQVHAAGPPQSARPASPTGKRKERGDREREKTEEKEETEEVLGVYDRWLKGELPGLVDISRTHPPFLCVLPSGPCSGCASSSSSSPPPPESGGSSGSCGSGQGVGVQKEEEGALDGNVKVVLSRAEGASGGRMPSYLRVHFIQSLQHHFREGPQE
uniref:Uncharacterized protein n=1 Tax=Chromera velia CCMP2878 TaxID=1169474 RepID=A0A0G4HQU6_9ALVE|eukprot:Cvel_30347.t1-p1 / transcript=Cvel_30347.t1 / gene=Cvel_30347 / organism=Chromera_velia_CCMP2878 / gene_product=hypothetical protein / transcript_product=hypothetical protein / location=Cvel_scaffold4310:4622-9560(-) / protein_length=506 / sequence_SO=supercontig / SO=protein_coding / is_pseudo=false